MVGSLFSSDSWNNVTFIANEIKNPKHNIGLSLFLGTLIVTIISVLLMVSTFGCNNGLILSGAGVYYTMAKDGLFFRQVGHLNKNTVPSKGLWIQCLWASVLCLRGRYGDLLDYIIFTIFIFYILTIIGIFILRRKRPDISRPYKAFGYPVLPLLYVIAASKICISLLIYKPKFTFPGLGIVLLGIPVYYFVLKHKHVIEEAPIKNEVQN